MTSKINILFYGTCQSKAIKDILNFNSNNFTQHHIQCYSTNISKDDFDNILKICDIIITQPIPDNYRDKDYLSTTYMINNCKTNCKVLIYQRQYFNFYYYDTIYYKYKEDVLHRPNDYHYKEMIEYHKQKKSVEDYLKEIVYNKNLKSKEELEFIANDSIKYLHDRDNDIINKYINPYRGNNYRNIQYVSVVNYIKDNYKNKLLFYSMNHPTKILLQFVANEIIKKLNNVFVDGHLSEISVDNSINYNIDPLNEPKCIIYSCIQNAVNFDISKEQFALCDKHDAESITRLYYDTYNEFV